MTQAVDAVPKVIWKSRDFVAGVVLVLVGIAAIVFTGELELGQANNFGPRMFPVLSAAGLIVLGLALASTVFSGPREQIEALSLRGPLFVVAAMLLFAATIRLVGLLPASFLAYVLSGLGSRESKPVELLLWGVLVAIACSVLFVSILGLPLPIITLP